MTTGDVETYYPLVHPFPLLQKACAEFQRKEDPTYRGGPVHREFFLEKAQACDDGIRRLSSSMWNKAFYNRRVLQTYDS